MVTLQLDFDITTINGLSYCVNQALFYVNELWFYHSLLSSAVGIALLSLVFLA